MRRGLRGFTGGRWGSSGVSCVGLGTDMKWTDSTGSRTSVHIRWERSAGVVSRRGLCEDIRLGTRKDICPQVRQ